MVDTLTGATEVIGVDVVDVVVAADAAGVATEDMSRTL